MEIVTRPFLIKLGTLVNQGNQPVLFPLGKKFNKHAIVISDLKEIIACLRPTLKSFMQIYSNKYCWYAFSFT